MLRSQSKGSIMSMILDLPRSIGKDCNISNRKMTSNFASECRRGETDSLCTNVWRVSNGEIGNRDFLVTKQRERERELYPNFLLATISNKILRSIFELWETNKLVVEKYSIWFAIKRISASVDRSGKKTCWALLIYLLPYDRCDT